MDQSASSATLAYLTTKEVADLLRVKERKVYDLAAAGEIPHRRITGKLLFPATEITAWIEGGEVPVERPAIVAGSHDPLVDWAIRESGCGLATLFDGSFSGLDRFTQTQAALCGIHIPEAEGWNIATLETRDLRDCVLIAWAKRTQGLIVAPGQEDHLQGLADIGGRRLVLRQPGAGARELFDQLSKDIDLSEARILDRPARTETDAAQAIAAGDADVALGLRAAAAQFRLGFVPLIDEQFDLLIDRRAYFTPPVQTLMAFAQTGSLVQKAKSLGGYDIDGLGQVRWLSR